MKMNGSSSSCLSQDVNSRGNSFVNVYENSYVIKLHDMERFDKRFKNTLTIFYCRDMETSNISQ